MPMFFRFVLFALLACMLHAAASALPRFALMTGMRCGSCHVNPTGGQMRSEFGARWGAENLSLPETRDPDFPISPKVTDNLSFGFDYRTQLIMALGKDPRDGQAGKTSFQAMTASLYGSFALSRKITLFFKEDFDNAGPYGLYNGPEVYGIARILPNQWYIKGGAFLPDYGWKLDDHTAYVRGGDLGFIPGGLGHNGLIFLPNYKDIGVELGGHIDNVVITTGLFNGTGNNTPIDFLIDKAYTVKLVYVGTGGSMPFSIGLSGYGFRSFKMGGITFGLANGDSNLVFLGEMDWTRNYWDGTGSIVTDGRHTMAAYAELDFRAIVGLWLTGKFDMYDPFSGIADDDASPATNSVKRVTVGAEFFPYPMVEVRPQFRMPIERPSVDNNQILVQMHLWF